MPDSTNQHNSEKHMLTVTCCNRCFSEIARKDTKAAKIWIDLCAHYVNAGFKLGCNETLIEDKISAFQNLETWGFLRSMDAPGLVHLRLIGHLMGHNPRNNGILHTFCINRSKHEDKWNDNQSPENTEAIPI